MHAPEFVCKALYRTHPQLRLAWQGRPRKYAGEINPGSFAIVQLYHVRDVGDLDDTFTFREMWDTTVVAGPTGTPERVRVQRGPIFSRDGSTRPDWDPLFRVPVFVMTLDEAYTHPDGEPIVPQDVLSGKILPTIREFLQPVKKRIVEADLDRKRDLKSKARDLGGQIGEELWYKAKRHDNAARRDIAYKHVRSQIARADHQIQRSKAKI